MHAAVNGFAHIVNRQQADRDGRERFHFYAGAADRFHRGLANDARRSVFGFKGDVDFGDGDRMAERNQVGAAFCALDRRNARDAQYVAFFVIAGLDGLERGRLHADGARGAGDAMGFGLGADIHHMRLALAVEVREIGGLFWHF